MNDDSQPEQRFLDLDEVSDSGEEVMEESGPEDYEQTDNLATTLKVESKASGEMDGQSGPKWSNPELYTVLPPPDESQKKRRNVLKLIRRARVAKGDKGRKDEAATNDDFISFGLDEEQSSGDESIHGEGMPGAPSGPRARNPQHLTTETPHYDKAEDNIVPRLRAGMKRERSPSDSDIGIQEPKRRKGPKTVSGGHVLEEWCAPKQGNPIPWLSEPHELTENSGFR